MKVKTVSNVDHISISIESLTLTANQRIALRLRESHDRQQSNSGLISWNTPSIMPLTTWLNHLALPALNKQILSNEQEQYLFEQIIQKTCSTQDILNPADTANTAVSAWKTLHLWDINFHELAQESNEEVALFYQWALQFQSQCEQQHWISNSEIPQHILQALPIIPYKKIQLVGFDDFPPIIERLLQAFTAQCEIIQIAITQSPESQYKIAFHDQASEMSAMAYWAKKQLTTYPQASIGCIIPELNTLRRSLFNTFTEVLNQDQLLPGYPLNKALFNISAGQKISEHPMIHVALSVIQWFSDRIDPAQLGNLLQSPYLHQSPEECDDAAQWDRMFRELNEQDHLADFFHATQQYTIQTEKNKQPSFLKRLYECHTLIKSTPFAATLPEWQQLFSQLLYTIGWPGYRILNSEEYQLYSRWQLLLEEFTHYDTMTHDTVELSEALYLLQKTASNTLFQTEGSLAPIQILGTLEAAGNTFDYMWIMGMDDNTWPPMASPNPFIPYKMQCDNQMPHATAERELIYTQQVMKRLQSSGTHIIFSYPLFEKDQAKNPSQFIETIPSTSLPTNQDSLALQAPPSCESLLDIHAPPVNSNESLKLSATTLQYQADCPFKAFAHTRLKATPLNEATFGLPDNQRGLLTHDALDRLWSLVTSQQQLTTLSQTELRQLISTITDAVIADQYEGTPFKKALLALEKNRLLRLLEEWLSYEKKRAPFRVTGTEISVHIPIHTLTFRVRIDRMDQLETGFCLIDYKTHTHNSINSWFGERPNDVQLPFYLSAHPNVNAIAYAEVSPNNCQFKGLANDTHTAAHIAGTKDIESFTKHTLTWSEQLALWQKTMVHLATEFEQGLASVTPRDPNKSCLYCELKPLCRVEHSFIHRKN